MSNDVAAIVITAAIFAVLFAWVPLLSLICPPCGRLLERLRTQRSSPKENSFPTAIREAKRYTGSHPRCPGKKKTSNSPAKTHVKPQNSLTNLQSMTCRWHFS